MTVFHDLGFGGVLYAVWLSLTWCVFGSIAALQGVAVFDYVKNKRRGDYG